ncbi:hypothetical protein [Pseudomonas sp. BAY1663]|uniref:hypothetical protein n=1 Tax=Pseudomonas sp. BAY1663 TaxID=1439940 RepID=UPI00056A2F5A|nr:hypothetical protein [Pseudomonas sp. BAY1663]
MTKQINPTDIFELARSTGRSPSEILDIAQREGWEIVEDAAPMPTQKAERKSVMHDPKGAIELMRQLKEDNIKKLYKNDPYIREGIDAQLAVQAARHTKTKPSNIQYNEQGNIESIKSSVVSGIHATEANQMELMQAIKDNIYKKYGVGSRA